MSPLQYRFILIFFLIFFCAEIPLQIIVKSASDAEIPLPRAAEKQRLYTQIIILNNQQLLAM